MDTPPRRGPDRTGGPQARHPEPPVRAGKTSPWFTLPGGNEGTPIYEELRMEHVPGQQGLFVPQSSAAVLCCGLSVVLYDCEIMSVMTSKIDNSSRRQMFNQVGLLRYPSSHTQMSEAVILEAATFAFDTASAPW